MWRLGSVRVRTTIAAALVVGVALLLGAALLVRAQRQTLTSDVAAAARARANDIATALSDGTLPQDLSVSNADEALVQVLDEQGKVVAASTNIKGEAPISAAVPPAHGFAITTLAHSPVANTRFLLATRIVQARGHRYVVSAAVSLEPVDDGTAALIGLLTPALPILVALVAAVTWIVVGRALRPVERLRTEVDRIQGSGDLDRRVTAPSGRDEVGRLATTMNGMLGRIQRSSERERRFVDDASHELRSPLAGMRSNLEVNLAHPERVARTAADRELLRTTLRMEHLVDDLLALARTDAGHTAPHDPVDLDDLVLDEVRALRPTTSVEIDCRSVSAGQVTGSREQLARVVRNLLDNAVRHARGQVSVSLEEHNGLVVLDVADDGPGIPAAERDRVFERFARLDEGRDREHGGTGLGLAIARDIVEAHDGTISVRDEGPGAHFAVALPARVPPAAARD